VKSLIRAMFPALLVISTSCGAVGNKTAPSDSLATAPVAVKPRWLTQPEVDKLNMDGDKKEVDALDAFVLIAHDENNREERLQGAVVMIKMALHDLYYDVDLSIRKHPSEDPAFYRSLVEFKERIGSPQAGIFTTGDMSDLFYYQQLMKYVDHNVSPLGLFRVSQTGGLTRAVGTWVIQGEKLASPINLATIDCWRTDGTCTITDAELRPPSKDSGSAYLTSNTSHWNITSWSDNRVMAEQTTVCRRLVLTLDVAAKQAYHVATDLTAEGCPVIGKLTAPRVTTLVKSSEVERRHYDEIRAELGRVSRAPYADLKRLLSAPSKVADSDAR